MDDNLETQRIFKFLMYFSLECILMKVKYKDENFTDDPFSTESTKIISLTDMTSDGVDQHLENYLPMENLASRYIYIYIYICFIMENIIHMHFSRMPE